jgi:hypothetical protein
MVANHRETENPPQTGTEITRSTFSISKHAVLRMAQRNISISDLEYVLEHGERINRTGITIYILRSRDILQGDRRTSKITRLEGTVVLTGYTPGGKLEIITIYRNKSGFKVIRGKAKYDRRTRDRTPRV